MVTKLAVAAVLAALPTGATGQSMQPAATCQHGFADAGLMTLGILFIVGLFLHGVQGYNETMQQQPVRLAKGKGRGNKRHRVVATQSQGHYTWRNQPPRFQLLGADHHGAWPQQPFDERGDDEASTGGLSRVPHSQDGASQQRETVAG